MRRLIAHALVITAIFDIADSKKSSNEIYIMLILMNIYIMLISLQLNFI